MTDRNGNRIGVNDSVWVLIRDGADRPDRRLAVVRTIERSIAGNPIEQVGPEVHPYLREARMGATSPTMLMRHIRTAHARTTTETTEADPPPAR
jgi:hypothetical protein